MFKKYKIPIVVSAFCLLYSALLYASTPVAETVTLGTTTGTGNYTHSRDYVSLKLVSIEVFNSADLTSTCTVTRVRSGRTNTVAAIALSDGAGIHRETNTIYLFKGDVLNFANSTATGAVAEITGVLEP
jgi:nanoRNase/pAp phosphatase (c-di-AMP/oligoRNAs hydrolase)